MISDPFRSSTNRTIIISLTVTSWEMMLWMFLPAVSQQKGAKQQFVFMPNASKINLKTPTVSLCRDLLSRDHQHTSRWKEAFQTLSCKAEVTSVRLLSINRTTLSLFVRGRWEKFEQHGFQNLSKQIKTKAKKPKFNGFFSLGRAWNSACALLQTKKQIGSGRGALLMAGCH